MLLLRCGRSLKVDVIFFLRGVEAMYLSLGEPEENQQLVLCKAGIPSGYWEMVKLLIL
jgi:hypothetical protein